MKKYLILLFVTSFSFAIIAQEGGNPPEPLTISIIPPSPTAASLGKYGAIPVSHYTGTPNISIPIYQVQSGDLQLPITLNYHASGIKVDEIASWVGLGWSLNAGGVITRTIRGLADESPNGFHGTNQIGQKVYDYNFGLMDPQELFTFRDNAAKGRWDTEPDVYYLNINGISGKIVFDKDNNPIIIPFQKLKIETLPSGGFLVTTADGTRYVFNDIEESFSENICTDYLDLPYPTAWYITQIISTKGDTINFTYEEETVNYTMGISDTDKFILPNQHAHCSISSTPPCESEFNSASRRLTQIKTANSIIKFIPGSRSDINGGSLLKAIEIYDTRDTINYKRQHNFYYSYFGNTTERLKLDSLQESFLQGISKPPHRFVYNNPSDVPPRLSAKQDHWGFFNNNPVNNLIPKMKYTYLDPANGEERFVILSGGSREPEEATMQACILTEIHYPTGGFTLFDFEAHDYGFFKNSEISYPRQIDTSASAYAFGRNYSEEQLFNIDTAQNVKITYSVEWDRPGEEVDLYVAIYDANNREEFFRYLWELGNADGSKVTRTTNLELSPGNYRVFAFSDVNNVNMGVSIKVDYTYEYRENGQVVNLKNKIAGGLRIKKMTIHDGISAENDMVRIYEYRLANESDRSSGVLISNPKYDATLTQYQGPPDYWTEVECHYLYRFSASRNILGMTQGSHVGYREVTIYEDKNKTNGKSYFKFISPFEAPDTGKESFPFPPSISNDYRRGLIDKSIDYKLEDGIYKKVRAIQNFYKYHEDTNKTIIIPIVIGYKASSNRDVDAVKEFEDGAYKYISQWFYLEKTTETIFDQDNQLDSLTISQAFFYENPNHIQLTKQVTTDSQGKIIESHRRYPLDYDTPGKAVDTLVQRHIVAPVIEQTQWVSGKLVSGTATKYTYNAINDFVYPETVHLIETNRDLSSLIASTDGVSFHPNFKPRAGYRYDDFGNIIQFAKTGDMPTSYVWSYNTTFPVVQAIGVDATLLETSVASAVNSLPAYSNGLDDLDVLLNNVAGLDSENKKSIWRDFNTALRDLLVEAQITTYTYDPLVGMTSQTDPNGLTTFYEYDEFNRLKLIRDHEDNIIQHYEYHYHDEAQGGGQ